MSPRQKSYTTKKAGIFHIKKDTAGAINDRVAMRRKPPQTKWDTLD